MTSIGHGPLTCLPHKPMTRRLLPILLLGLSLAVIPGLPSPAETPALAVQSDPASEILQLINQFRAKQGLPPFQYNGTLASAAQAHANWMAASSIVSHTGSAGSSPLSRAMAAGYVGYVVENIVGGTKMSPRQGLIWWQNSPIHYNTLVTSRYPQAGVGFASNGEQNMYVLLVGRPPGPDESAPSVGGADTSAAPLIITPIQLAEPREDGSIVHVMQQGQALWTVAAYYDVDLDYLYLINALTEADVLHPGDEVTVRLADGVEPPPTPTPPLTHVVRDGESAWSIALQHGIDLGFLYLLNNMTEDTMLHPGDEVVVRLAEGQAPPPTPTPRITHIVQSGQSLWLIAAIYNLTLEQLMGLNDLTTESIIRPGDELRVRFPTPTPMPTETSTPPPAGTADAMLAANPSPKATRTVQTATLSQLSPTAGAVPGADRQNKADRDLLLGLTAIAGLAALSGAVIVASRRRNP